MNCTALSVHQINEFFSVKCCSRKKKKKRTSLERVLGF